MKRLILLAAMLLAAPITAQQTDTVPITIYDRSDVRVEVTPENYRGFRGDTITFVGVAIDVITGDTLDVELRWRTDSPSALDLDSLSGHATFNNRGQYNVWPDVIRFTGFVVFGSPEDQATPYTELVTLQRATYLGVPPDTLDLTAARCVRKAGVDPERPCIYETDGYDLCAYSVLDGVVVGKSHAECPDAVLDNLDEIPVGEIPVPALGSWAHTLEMRAPTQEGAA